MEAEGRSGPSNDTLSGAENLDPSFTAPAGVTCNAGTPGNAAAPTTCSLGDLAPGATRTVTITTRVNAGALTCTTVNGVSTCPVLSNSADVTSNTPDQNPSNNSVTLTVTILSGADLGVTVIDSPDPVVVNDNITYTITVTNIGPAPAVNAVLSTGPPRVGGAPIMARERRGGETRTGRLPRRSG